MAENVSIEDGKHDLGSILCSSDRDFLVRNNGDQVDVKSLKGNIVGLYFSKSWCFRFTRKLVEAYNELKEPGKNFEIVLVSGDRYKESFDENFSDMPWLAIPFSDAETHERLNELFSVSEIPHMVILDENGKVLSDEGVEIIQEHGEAGYPFDSDHIEKLKELEEEARKNQPLKYLLASKSRDYAITADGKKVPITELEGKTVGLYFVLLTYDECRAFNSKLVEVYKSLKEEGEEFEIVMIPLDEDESSFQKEFVNVPWLSLPLKDKKCDKLFDDFDVGSIPTVLIIGADGKTLHSNVVEFIEEHGKKAYPFTPEKLEELEEIEKAKIETQTPMSLLVSEDYDFVIGKDGAKVPVSNLVGKNILLYFSSHWCPPCRAFLPKLVQAYQEINAKDNSLEVVYISYDGDQDSFDEVFSTMPWPALPFGDKRKKSLSRLFNVDRIPTVVAIGPTGKTVTTDTRDLIMSHGAEAYPFSEERLKELNAKIEKMAEEWPKQVKFKSHEHELLLTKHEVYYCDGCEEEGRMWLYYCEDCNFNLHPKCALNDGERLNELFSVVDGVRDMVILGENGKVLSDEGVSIIRDHGGAGYPFDSCHIEKLKELEEEARKNQSLKYLLVWGSRDYVITADGKKVPITDLEGKTVGLYFVDLTCKDDNCRGFNTKLVEVYKSLKEEGEEFEIVMIPEDQDESAFQTEFENMPWLSLPLKDKKCEKLNDYFEPDNVPAVVIIGPDGKTLHSNVVEFIEEHGKKAYPFTPEKLAELEEIEKAKREAQTLESLLVSEDYDFVIGKDGAKIPVSNLIGKNILLYFSAHWCPPCRAFLPKLVQVYQEINAKDNSLEVIYVSSDRDQNSFDEFFSMMPWPALPFGDKRKESLSHLFKIQGIPAVVAIGPNGRTVTTEARELIMSHGAEAYPFSAERLKELEAKIDKMAEEWPKKVKFESHEHELLLTKCEVYSCDECGEEGWMWSYYCEDCDFDLHPKCALDDGENEKRGEDVEENRGEGWICDGEKCYRE